MGQEVQLQAERVRSLKWKKSGEYCALADEREDGSRYMMLRLQDGKCYYAVWQWPKERRFKTDGREMWRDVIYDGPDRMAAVEACEKHLAKRVK